MNKAHNEQTITETEELLRRTAPQNIMVSFGDKPPKTLEEYVKAQRKENPTRHKHYNDRER